MATDFRSKTQKIGYLRQTTGIPWDNPQAPSANFQTTNYDVETVTPDPDVQIDELAWTAQDGVMSEEGRIYTDFKTGLMKMPFSGTVIKNQLATHLVAAFQNVTEGGPPYSKTFTFSDTVLDFSNNDGFLWTIAEGNLTSFDGVILENAILDTYTLTCDMGARGIDRLLKHSGTWIGNEMNTEQNLSGSWASAPTVGFYNNPNTVINTFALQGLTIGGDVLDGACLRGWEFTISNNVTTKCITTKPGNYNIAQEAMMTIRFFKNSTTLKAFKGYQIGDNVDLYDVTTGGLYNGLSKGADLNLSFDSRKGYITENPKGFEDEYQTIDVTFKMIRPTTGWGTICYMTDTVNGAY